MIVSACQCMQATAESDAQLVDASLKGDRQAFGRIVERYQTLICSLAYNATGSLIQSEDLAQETFIAAWKRLGELREPNKLRAWLCGIARNLANNSIRRGRRDATRDAEPVEHAAGAASHDRGPVEEAISREEEAILWRSLERIHELYREPLILFYRENQSVERVAEALEISEDTVKQRLSRGRKMLQEQVASFVEGALRRSTPGKAFAFGVIAALPAVVTSTSAATLGAGAVKGTIAAKSASGLGLLGALLGPVLGSLGGYIGAKLSIENTKSKRERQFMVRLSWAAAISAFGFTAAFLFLMLNARAMLASNPRAWVAALIALVFGYVLLISVLTHWANRRQRQIRREEAANGSITEPPAGTGKAARHGAFEYRSKISLLGWPLVHVRVGKAAD